MEAFFIYQLEKVENLIEEALPTQERVPDELELALGQQALEMLRAYPACRALPPNHKSTNSKMCKLETLNEWNADKLALFSDLPQWETLGFAWQQLLIEFPGLLARLKGFEHKPQTDQVLYERMKLAEYLYPG